MFPVLEQIQTPSGRFYKTPEGVLYPSVTTVLGVKGNEGIEEWKKAVGEEEAKATSRRASARGTRIHKYAEDLLMGKEIEYANVFDKVFFKPLIPIVSSFTDVRCIEQKMYSDYLKSAGATDLVAKYNNKLSIGDWKTSNTPKYHSQIHTYFMQTAAYAVMYEERTGTPITQLVVVIGVESDEPQVFVEHRDNWVSSYMELRKIFTEKYESVKV